MTKTFNDLEEETTPSEYLNQLVNNNDSRWTTYVDILASV